MEETLQRLQPRSPFEAALQKSPFETATVQAHVARVVSESNVGKEQIRECPRYHRAEGSMPSLHWPHHLRKKQHCKGAVGERWKAPGVWFYCLTSPVAWRPCFLTLCTPSSPLQPARVSYVSYLPAGG